MITDRTVSANRPNIVLMCKNENNIHLVDITIPNTNNSEDK